MFCCCESFLFWCSPKSVFLLLFPLPDETYLEKCYKGPCQRDYCQYFLLVAPYLKQKKTRQCKMKCLARATNSLSTKARMATRQSGFSVCALGFGRGSCLEKKVSVFLNLFRIILCTLKNFLPSLAFKHRSFLEVDSSSGHDF